MIRSPCRFLAPARCARRSSTGGMLAQLAVDAPPAFAAVPASDISITSTDSSSVFGQSVTLNSTVTGGAGTPTGTVDVFDGATSDLYRLAR